MGELTGRVALVTGGSRGIGAAIARRLAAEGADVALTYRRGPADAVAEAIAAAGRRALAIAADSGDGGAVEAAVDRTAAELGRLDILVNNAGVFPFGPFEDVTDEELDRTLAVHVRGVFAATRAAVRHMGEGGRVISIGSTFVDRVPYAGVTLYTMSKAALGGMTRGLARDLGPRGITANVVASRADGHRHEPGRRSGRRGGGRADRRRPLRRPDDVALTVAHLAGPRGRYITGAAISVDGGWAA